MIEFETLPKGWTIAKLGDICFTTSGGTPSRNVPNYYRGNIPWVKSGELDKGLILDTEEKITEEAIKNSSAKVFPKGTLLIALYGATVGKLAFLGIDATTNQAVCGIYKSEAIESKLLYYFLLLQKSNLVSQSIGGAQPNISQGIIKDLNIPLAPLNEQKRILAKIEQLLTDLDKGIEFLETTKQQLKVYRQAVLKWAFEGKLTNTEIYIKKVSDIAFVNPKLPFEKIDDDLEVQFLPMKLVEEVINKINLTEIKKYKEVKKGFTPMTNGDVIFAKITPCMENGKIAVVHSLKNEIAFGSTEFHVFRTKENYLNTYLFHFLVQEKVRQDAEQNMTGAVGQRRVPKKFLEDLEIPTCSFSNQQKIVSEIESRLSVCDKIEETIESSLQQAEALRLSIIKKAFEGKLVLQDPNNEPAEKLLERIRALRQAQGKQGNGKPEKKEKGKAEKNKVALAEK